MNHSKPTQADVAHSATILCNNNNNYQDKHKEKHKHKDDDNHSTDYGPTDVVMSISGTTLLPGNAHSDPPVAKQISIQIFGDKGALLYSGNDRDGNSGRLELREESGAIVVLQDRFDFENLDDNGTGPESLHSFLDACLGQKDIYVGADALLGLRTVQTIDAMYRSNQTKQMVDVKHSNVVIEPSSSSSSSS